MGRDAMIHVDRWIKEVSAYGVVGGIASVPIALSEFPWIYGAMLLPLIVSLVQILILIHKGCGFVETWIYSPGPYVGTACTYHLYHGAFDYQGVVMGLVGWVLLAPVLYAVARASSDHARNAEAELP